MSLWRTTVDDTQRITPKVSHRLSLTERGSSPTSSPEAEADYLALIAQGNYMPQTFADASRRFEAAEDTLRESVDIRAPLSLATS